jgi:hypothetical protein
MSRLNVEVKPGFSGISEGSTDIESFLISVTNDQGKPVTDLADKLQVKTLAKPPNAAGDLALGFDYAEELWPGFYRAMISPPGGETWKSGFYVLGFVFKEVTFGSLYPLQILGSNNGQALMVVHVSST